MKKYILALSDAYLEEEFHSGELISLRDIDGTNCYCSPESAILLRERLSGIPTDALHWIDTGDYHYLTLFFVERIAEPFELVLVDHHPDNQEASFGVEGLLSCGSWMNDVVKLDNYRKSGGYPVYLSVDLDFLSPEVFKTDWDQGDATLEDMLALIFDRVKGRRILGIDICGGITRSKGATDKDLADNKKIRERLVGLLPMPDRNQ